MDAKVATIFAIVIGISVFCIPKTSSQGIQPRWETLAAGAEVVNGPFQPGFTCEGKIYGYYADTFNACRIFHVCRPTTDERGTTHMETWSFFCGNQTVFNQERLICDHPDIVDCSQAQNFYSVNEEFGRVGPRT